MSWLEERTRGDEIWKREHLQKAHTKQLLDYLNRARKCGGFYSPVDKNGPGFTVEELKAELATRPHVPSKTEGAAKRRAAATAHHGPKKRRKVEAAT